MWDFLLTKNGVMVAAAVGAAVGAVISHFATRSMVRKEFDEELRQVREHYQSKVVNNVGFQDEAVKLVVDKHRKIYESIVKDSLYGVRLDEDGAILNPEDIPNTIMTPDGERIMVTPEEAELDARGEMYSMQQRSEEKPYLISYEEFTDDNGYDKSTLTFYQKDESLADDRDDLVDDPFNTCGELYFDFFGWRSHDENVVYVRNPKTSHDFEIVYDDGSYAESILGMEPLEET